jgi:hypothetical protein
LVLQEQRALRENKVLLDQRVALAQQVSKEARELLALKVQLALFQHPMQEMFGHLQEMDQQPLGH